MAKKKDLKVELHAHSNGSSDGIYSIDEMISMASKQGVEYLAITDHNTYSEIRKFYVKNGFDLNSPLVEKDGVKIIPGVEVTCRVGEIKNLSGNSTKLHVLLYGGDMSPNSPISKLLEYKRKNDLDCDIGMLRDLLCSKGYHNISEDEIRAYIRYQRLNSDSGFSSFGKKDVWNFLQQKGITIASSYKQLCEMISTLPKYERLNIDFSKLLEVAHASGCEVYVAHLALNAERTAYVPQLLDFLVQRVDGFEMVYPQANDQIRLMLLDSIKNNKREGEISFSGGTDFHDASHGEIMGQLGTRRLTANMFPTFFDNLNDLVSARAQGKLSHRVYNIDMDSINDYLKYIVDDYKRIMANSNTDMSHYKTLKAIKKRLKKEAKAKAKSESAGIIAKAANEKIREKSKSEWEDFNARKKNGVNALGINGRNRDDGYSPR